MVMDRFWARGALMNRFWARCALAACLGLGFAAMAARAQPAGEAAAVQQVIKEYYANPRSSVVESDITVTGIKIEGPFAKANVTIKKIADHPTVFLQKKRNQWDVIFDNTLFEAATCQRLGFPKSSKLCPP